MKAISVCLCADEELSNFNFQCTHIYIIAAWREGERRHVILTMCLRGPAAIKEPFEWLSNSWELWHGHSQLMQQRLPGRACSGLEMWRSFQFIPCEFLLAAALVGLYLSEGSSAFYSTLAGDDWIQVDMRRKLPCNVHFFNQILSSWSQK